MQVEENFKTRCRQDTLIRPERIGEAMSKALEQDMDAFSSQEALDYERAYYKVCKSPFYKVLFC